MSSPVPSTSRQRDLQIEVLRLRADYQRLAWKRSACQLLSQMQPAALIGQTRDQLGSAGLGWIGTGLGLLRRYPMVLSLLGSVIGTPKRRRLALKAALIAGLVWLGKRKPPSDLA
ncbi:hypothetical protein [Castellaniella sp.]|uniref:hypothetical protein n=1 Tax=Castellaniella sp. TaxID=1955812 RepID=UPI002AFFF2D4|nr:hypothetical protein [Castellaniella sp.]